jgi:hypothetical protein
VTEIWNLTPRSATFLITLAILVTSDEIIELLAEESAWECDGRRPASS